LFIARIQLNNYCSLIRILAEEFSEDWIEVIAVTHFHLAIQIKKIFFKIKSWFFKEGYMKISLRLPEPEFGDLRDERDSHRQRCTKLCCCLHNDQK
jgi:hypothetical protein